MDIIVKLDAIESIKRLKALYFFCMDTKNWEKFAEVFAEDCVMDMAGEAPPGVDPAMMVYRGRDQIIGAISQGLSSFTTVHHGHTPIIDIESDDSASGIWAMEDNFYFPDGGHMEGYGHYRDQYRKVDGQWRIAATTVTRLRKSMTPGG